MLFIYSAEVWYKYINKCVNDLDDIHTTSSTTSPQEPTSENLYTLDMELDDSDFEQGSDRELRGLFFPEVWMDEWTLI